MSQEFSEHFSILAIFFLSLRGIYILKVCLEVLLKKIKYNRIKGNGK